METGSGGRPTEHEAREALAQAAQDEDAVRYPPLPRWFFLAQAALVGCLCLAQLLPPSDARNATFGTAVAAIVLSGRYWLFRDRVSGVLPSFGDMLPFLAASAGTVLTCLVVAETTGAGWVWILGAVVVGAIVLSTGRTYRKTYGDAS
jgi:hypothetical protein